MKEKIKDVKNSPTKIFVYYNVIIYNKYVY